MQYIASIILLIMLTLTTSAEETTTSNLLSQDFSTGWSGTATLRHGNGTVAAVNNTYIKSDDVSLKDDGSLTEPQLQDGFTSNHSFKYWHWNDYDSTVTSTVTITGADGETTTQIRVYSTEGCGSINCGAYEPGSDTLSVSRNTQTDYDINVRYDFTDTSNSTSHYSVDLKEPSLTVTYESEPIDQSIQDEINDVLEDLQEEVFEDMEEFFFEEETFNFNEEPTFEMGMETFTEEFFDEIFMEMEEEFFTEEGMTFEDSPMFEFTETEMEEIYEETNEIVDAFLPMVSEEEEFSSEESFIESDGPIFMEPTEGGEAFEEEEMMEEPTEMAEEEMIEEENTEMVEEETIEEEPTEMVEAENEETFEEEAQEEESTSETATTSTVQAKKLAKQKKIQQKKDIVKNLARIMDKVDKDVKDIAKNLAIKNIIKMDAMTSEQASLAMYQNAVFYKPKNIYLNQLNIFDDRQIYPNTNLASYVQNDKIEIKAKKLGELNLKKQQLLYELKMLKNGQT